MQLFDEYTKSSRHSSVYMPEKDPADPSDQPAGVKTCGRVRLPYIFAVRCGRKDGIGQGTGTRGGKGASPLRSLIYSSGEKRGGDEAEETGFVPRPAEK